MARLRVPISTYRLQFSGQFRFADASAILGYLHHLGVTDLYASPLLKARKGSTHGYDVTDPTQLNPELGTPEEFAALAQGLRTRRMGLLLDIVPNHMAASPENPWWVDILENGVASMYAAFFDIDWGPALNGDSRVLLPILGRPYGEALEDQELQLGLDPEGLAVRYYGLRLPLDVRTYSLVLAHRLLAHPELEHPDFQALLALVQAVEELPRTTVPGARSSIERHVRQRRIKQELWRLWESSPRVRAFLEEALRRFNGVKGNPESFDLLDLLLSRQAYRLAHWRTGPDEVNYRRFFDINDLAGVRVEEPHVFQAVHGLVLRLAREGSVTGLRIDHVDGLADPLGYLRRLQRQLSPHEEHAGGRPGFYVVVEKILSSDERLPQEWPVFGTTGYDFSRYVTALFVDNDGLRAIERVHSRFTGDDRSFADLVYEKKHQVIEDMFASEAYSLGMHLARLALDDRHACDVPRRDLTRAIVEVTACLPVYRTYTRTMSVSPRDAAYIERAVTEAAARSPGLESRALRFLHRVLRLDFPPGGDAALRDAWLRFVVRWQQFTGPIMAKGLEDTALYAYTPLVSLNLVGGDPGAGGVTVEEFHQHNLERAAHWPATMNATSTHDSKRSEDVRARINVLSEVPALWERHLLRWHRWNQPRKRRINGTAVPEPSMEVLIYQTLIGAWPLDAQEVPEFRERLKAYVIKAAREAKTHTTWLSPNPQYEEALLAFVDALFDNGSEGRFLSDFLAMQRVVASYGAVNALAQVVLKAASPGVPDFYQGTELWDFSLVDPDNRRPVDFALRQRLLQELTAREAQDSLGLAKELLHTWEDGRIKLYTTARLLRLRRALPSVFLQGDYLPLEAQGRRRFHVCAFARRADNVWVLVAVPRLLTGLVDPGRLPLGGRVWHGDMLKLPADAPHRWTNVFTGEALATPPDTHGLPLARVLAHFPVAVLQGTAQ